MKSIICASFLMLGCANTAVHSDMLKSQGAIRFEVESAGIYKVFIKNTEDFNWSGEDKADRLKTSKNLLREECKSIELIDEDSIQTGTYRFGMPAKTWIMRFSCIK